MTKEKLRLERYSFRSCLWAIQENWRNPEHYTPFQLRFVQRWAASRDTLPQESKKAAWIRFLSIHWWKTYLEQLIQVLLTFSRFISPSSWTISSRRLSCRADMRNSNSSLRCLSNLSSASSCGFWAIWAADLDVSSCSSRRRRISFSRSLWNNNDNLIWRPLN